MVEGKGICIHMALFKPQTAYSFTPDDLAVTLTFSHVNNNPHCFKTYLVFYFVITLHTNTVQNTNYSNNTRALRWIVCHWIVSHSSNRVNLLNTLKVLFGKKKKKIGNYKMIGIKCL